MILVATGLRREARLLDGANIRTIVSGGVCDSLAQRLCAEPAAQGILSAGLAGALAPDLAPGACLVATHVVDGADVIAADLAWSAALAERLPRARSGAITGVNSMLVSADDKAALRARSGAQAVDMESHVAARFARARSIPFAAVRVISDAAHRNLPPAVRVGMRSNGGMDGAAVLRALFRDPDQFIPLLRAAYEAETAFRVLAGLRIALGARFALPT